MGRGGAGSVRPSHQTVAGYTQHRWFPNAEQSRFPTACRRLENLVLPSISDTSLSFLMVWKLPTFKVKRSLWSRSPGRFTHRRVGASGSCSGWRVNALAVGNCCYVFAVCSANSSFEWKNVAFLRGGGGQNILWPVLHILGGQNLQLPDELRWTIYTTCTYYTLLVELIFPNLRL